jgi:DNA-binding NtrC family response regulator
VVLTESALPDGAWLDVLELAHEATPEPNVIVTRPGVDSRTWCEVLNLGGYDMLAQPFSEPEVRRVLSNACARAA